MAQEKRKDNLWCYLATVYPLGKSKWAPGTVGSLGGIPLAFIGKEAFGTNLLSWTLFFLAFTAFSWYVIYKAETFWRSHDDKSIVLDEVLGQAIALAPTALGGVDILVCFAAFRLLDIWKPGPIGYCDRHLGHAFGTLMDDILAGAIVAAGYVGVMAYI